VEVGTRCSEDSSVATSYWVIDYCWCT